MNFPYDKQTCTLEFVAWSYTKHEVLMKGDTVRGIELDFFQLSPAWEVTDYSWSADTTGSETSIVFTITLVRKSMFVFLTILLPVLLLSILNIFTFVLSCEGGEKSVYSITIFLAFAVFLTIVESTLPTNSDNVSRFSLYLVMMTTTSTTITVIIVVFNRIANWDEKVYNIPRWLKKFSHFIDFIACTCCLRKRHKVDVQPLNTDDMTVASLGKEGGMDSASQASRIEDCTWRSIVSSLDLVCFVVFFIYCFLSNLLFIVLAYSQY